MFVRVCGRVGQRLSAAYAATVFVSYPVVMYSTKTKCTSSAAHTSDDWLTGTRRLCPTCKRDILAL